jgi:hypothetical protein
VLKGWRINGDMISPPYPYYHHQDRYLALQPQCVYSCFERLRTQMVSNNALPGVIIEITDVPPSGRVAR